MFLGIHIAVDDGPTGSRKENSLRGRESTQVSNLLLPKSIEEVEGHILIIMSKKKNTLALKVDGIKEL